MNKLDLREEDGQGLVYEDGIITLISIRELMSADNAELHTEVFPIWTLVEMTFGSNKDYGYIAFGGRCLCPSATRNDYDYLVTEWKKWSKEMKR